MIFIGKKLSFINCIITWQLFLEMIVGFLMHIFFFNVGYINFFTENSSKEILHENCNKYIHLWLVFWAPIGIFHVANVFYRYICIRYADSFLVEETKILKFVVILFFGLFTILIFSYNLTLMDGTIGTSIKGHFCSMKNLNFTNHEARLKLSIKPKLNSCVIIALFGIYTFWMFNFSMNFSKKFKVLKYQRNLYTMKAQCIITLCVVFLLEMDQVVNIFIELNYAQLGHFHSFAVWWVYHLLESGVYVFVKNIWVLQSARNNYPEFSGYSGKSFPGQELPKSQPPGRLYIDFLK